MGVISMQMSRQHNNFGQSKPRPLSSRKVSNSNTNTKSKKRRFALYPPKQYPSVDMHSSCRNKRCSSPSHQSSIEGLPPRHPLSLSSSLSSLSDALHIPNEIVYTKSLDLIIDEYKNEKFPAEMLARLQRRRVNDMYNCDASTSTNDSDNQRDEDNEEYTTSSSNDTLGFSDTSEEGEKEPIGQTKESIFELITKRFVRSIVRNAISKRIVGSLVKSKENENEDTTDNKDDANEEEVGADEQNKVLSNETFRLLLSSQDEDANSSLRTKESSERQEERVSVFEIDFEYLDIGH